MSAHAAGFMVKDSLPKELIEAIRTVAGGGRVVAPPLAFVALNV